MNLSYTVVSVINLPSIMSTIVTTTLHGILMMGTHQAMILIKAFPERSSRTLQDAPEQLQKPRIAQEPPLQIRLLFSTHTSRVDSKLLFTARSRTLYRVTISEKQGDKTLFINNDQLLFTQQCPDRIIGVTVCFRLKSYSPEGKAFHLP